MANSADLSSVKLAVSAPHASGTDALKVSSASTGVLVLLVILWSLLGPKIAARCRFLPEGSTACLLGLTAGCALLAFYKYITAGVVRELLQFDAPSFFTYLLPPVIFNAGVSVERRSFFQQLPSILAFGIVGTAISFVVISLVLYGFTEIAVLNLEDCLALGAIFAATDSVATLQVLDQDAMPLLFGLVFGEGVINDATSVVLLGAVTKLFPRAGSAAAPGGDASPGRLFLGLLGNFCYLFSSSLAMGLGIGLGIAFLLKHTKCHGAHQEVALVGLLAYLAYLLPEVLGLSGILALFCCGIAVSHYALHNISRVGRSTTIGAFKTLSYISEGLIFIYLGMDALDPGKWRASYGGEAALLFCALVVLLLVSRAANVIPLSLLHNAWSSEQLRARDIVIIWWSGLMRGAVSVALVYYHFDMSQGGHGTAQEQHRATLIAATLVTVLFTVLGFGALTRPLLTLMLQEPARPLAEILRLRFGGCMDVLRWGRSTPGRSGSISTLGVAGGATSYQKLETQGEPCGVALHVLPEACTQDSSTRPNSARTSKGGCPGDITNGAKSARERPPLSSLTVTPAAAHTTSGADWEGGRGMTPHDDEWRPLSSPELSRANSQEDVRRSGGRGSGSVELPLSHQGGTSGGAGPRGGLERQRAMSMAVPVSAAGAVARLLVERQRRSGSMDADGFNRLASPRPLQHDVEAGFVFQHPAAALSNEITPEAPSAGPPSRPAPHLPLPTSSTGNRTSLSAAAIATSPAAAGVNGTVVDSVGGILATRTLSSFWADLDRNYLQPVFGGPSAVEGEEGRGGDASPGSSGRRHDPLGNGGVLADGDGGGGAGWSSMGASGSQARRRAVPM